MQFQSSGNKTGSRPQEHRWQGSSPVGATLAVHNVYKAVYFDSFFVSLLRICTSCKPRFCSCCHCFFGNNSISRSPFCSRLCYWCNYELRHSRVNPLRKTENWFPEVKIVETSCLGHFECLLHKYASGIEFWFLVPSVILPQNVIIPPNIVAVFIALKCLLRA